MARFTAQSTAAEVVSHDLDAIVERGATSFARLAGKHLLIVGGAGFLGYEMVQAAVRWNRDSAVTDRIRISVLDNFMRGVPAWLTDLGANGAINQRTHDVTHPLPADLAPAQYIVHAASIASPLYYRRHPIETMDANVNGTRLLLDHARVRQSTSDPVEGLLYFSTSEIYGDPSPDSIPTPETYRGFVSCTGPRACYDESKRYGETLCVNFAQQHGVAVSIARPFNNYGPGLKITDARVLPDFARDVFNGRDITLLSDGTPTRTYCYIADSTTGYFKVLTHGRAGEPYNIGTDGPEISMAELADRFGALAKDLVGWRGCVVRSVSADPQYLVDNPNRRCPVIDKARTELGYEPIVDLDDGLGRSLLWYRDHQTAEEA